MGNYTARNLSTFPVFIIYRFFTEIPDSLLESARLDGAREWQLFYHIGLPMGSSGVIAAMVLGFLEYWNAIEQPMTYLKTEARWPLSLYLPQMVSAETASAFAASIVTLLPAVLLFLSGQEYLEQGIAASKMERADQEL